MRCVKERKSGRCTGIIFSGDRIVKFTANSKDLAAAVVAASKIVKADTTIKILENVILTASETHLHVRATDLSTTLEHSFEVDVSEVGSITIPAKLFAAYLSKLPADVVEVAAESGCLAIKRGRSNYTFHTLPADDYPPLPMRQ